MAVVSSAPNLSMRPPDISYLICATPRSGSYLLCEALTKSGVAGRPAEYFWRDHAPYWRRLWGVTGERQYLEAAVMEATTPNGVFGAKTVWAYLDYLTDMLRAIRSSPDRGTHDLLTSTFPNLRYISITRRDKVRQAVSHWRARQTNIWMWKEDRPPIEKGLRFDPPEVDRLLEGAKAEEAAWQHYFEQAGVVPLRLEYETLAAAYEQTAYDVLAYLEIPLPDRLAFGERHMQKQADDQSERWVEAYYAWKAERDLCM